MLTTQSYENSVFVNCPFDREYWPLFEAITFAVCHCGFYPRCALEVDDSSQVRIEKITRIIKACRLSVHDISRIETDGDPPMPRFNMPLELGIFLGAKSFGTGEQKKKAGVVLDTEQYRYQRYMSHIAGQDIRAHRGEPEQIIRHVRNFLATHTPASEFLPGPDRIADRYRNFRKHLPALCRFLHLDARSLTFSDLTRLIVGYMRS
ncbi:MAG TPA: hypothetical protein VGB66_07090 [Longimicrobium sp.]|jgi:hypothetical protein